MARSGPDRPGPELPLVAGDTVLQTRSLEAGLSARRYHEWIAGLATPYLGRSPIEFGSGLGNYAAQWLADADPAITSMTLVERDAARMRRLQEIYAGDARIHVSDQNIFDPSTGGHTSLVAYNFLEHLEQDSRALESAHALCLPGSPVVIFVPAFPFAFGKFDAAVGHYRRYTTMSLQDAFLRAGLQPTRLHYVNALGLATWFLAVRLLGLSPTYGRLVRLWDALVVPLSRTVEGRFRPPFGQSVFGVARVPPG